MCVYLFTTYIYISVKSCPVLQALFCVGSAGLEPLALRPANGCTLPSACCR